MDNAYNEMIALNLGVGIELTSDQIAALNSDIMWMVAEVVDGENVLVPVVYLSAATMAGLNGQGSQMIAGNNATINATDTLKNGGLILAGNDLTATATNDITNTGKIKAGRDISLISTSGSINNLATVNRSTSGANIYQNLVTQGDITSGRNTTLNAAQDINNVGSKITAGGNATLTAGNDINVVTDVLHNHSEQHGKHSSSVDDTVENVQSTITSGGNTTATAGNDINILGSKIEAKGDVGLTAGNDIIIANQTNEESHKSNSTKKTLKSTVTHTKETFDTQNVASEITAGGNFTSASGGNTAVIGSEITTKNGDITMTADKQIVIANATETHYSYEKNDKEASMFGKTLAMDGWGNKGPTSGALNGDEEYEKKHTTSSNTVVMSKINSGGNLSLTSHDDMTILASHLEGDDVTLKSTDGKIKLLSAKNTNSESDENSKSSTSWHKDAGEGYSSEEVVMTEIVARNALVLNAAKGVEVDIKNSGSVQESIDILSKQPGLEYLAQLKNDPNIDWNQVNDAFNHWDYQSQGLTAVAAVIIAIVVAIFTAGAGAAAMGAMGFVGAGSVAAGTAAVGTTVAVAGGTATVISATTMAAMTAAISAGTASLASTTLISTINNGGNMGDVLKEIGSDEYLKSLAISVVSAGATAGAADALGYATATPAAGTAANPSGSLTSSNLTWGQQATKIGVNATIGAGVETIVNGDGLDQFGDSLVDRLKTGVVYAVGAQLAEDVGGKFHVDEALGENTPLSNAVHIATHAAIGCGIGAGTSGDCQSGAIGGAIGELGAEFGSKQLGMDAETAAKFGQFSALGIALIAGSDAEGIYTASGTAQNAIQNNFLKPAEVSDWVNKYSDCSDQACRDKVSSVYIGLAKERYNNLDDALQASHDKDVLDLLQSGLNAGSEAERAAYNSLAFALIAVGPSGVGTLALTAATPLIGKGLAGIGGVASQEASQIGSGADNVVNATLLKQQLQNEEIYSIFMENGVLKQSVVDSAKFLKGGDDLTNPAVIKELTKNGSQMADWAKFSTTEPVTVSSGEAVQMHFYKNINTGEINYNIDFKPVIGGVK
jgi:filamentous hemagglutinin